MEHIEKNLEVIGVDINNGHIHANLLQHLIGTFKVEVTDNEEIVSFVEEELGKKSLAFLVIMNSEDIKAFIIQTCTKTILDRLMKKHVFVAALGASPFLTIKADDMVCDFFGTAKIDETDFDEVEDLLAYIRMARCEDDKVEDFYNYLTTDDDLNSAITAAEEKLAESSTDDDSAEDGAADTAEDKKSEFTFYINVKHHPCYTRREIRQRVHNRINYHWDLQSENIEVTRNPNGTFTAKVTITTAEELTNSEVREKLNYRFGASCPRHWYNSSVGAIL